MHINPKSSKPRPFCGSNALKIGKLRGLSKVAFCKQHDLNPCTFKSWRKRFLKDHASSHRLKLVPIATANHQHIPDYFPRRKVLQDVTEAEKVCGCGTERQWIGEEISEQVDVVPASVEVIRHVRPKYACPSCEGLESTDGTLLIKPPPKQLIPKSLAAPGSLAGVTTAKFAEAIPFYRHEK